MKQAVSFRNTTTRCKQRKRSKVAATDYWCACLYHYCVVQAFKKRYGINGVRAEPLQPADCSQSKSTPGLQNEIANKGAGRAAVHMEHVCNILEILSSCLCHLQSLCLTCFAALKLLTTKQGSTKQIGYQATCPEAGKKQILSAS